jgi:multiple sugar transport system substrate-binding protein
MPIEVTRKDYLYQSIILLLVILLLGLLLASSRQVPAEGQVSSDPTALTSTPQSTTPPPTPRPFPTPTPTLLPPSSLISVDPSSLNGQTISFWHPWSEETGKTVEALIAEFNNSNEWGITVTPAYQGSYDELSENVSAAIKAGKPPDVAVGYNYQALNWDSSTGILVDLSDYVVDPTWGFTPQEQKDFYPIFWDHDVADGKRTGIPAQRSAQLIYYNLTWAQELGFTSPPTTPEQFKSQACAAAKANKTDADPQNDGTGGWIISTDYASTLGWIEAFGGEVIRPDGKGYQFNTPEANKAFTFLRDLLDNGCAWIPTSQFTEEELASRRGLFATGTVPGIPIQENAFAKIDSKDEWTVLPFPSPAGDPVIEVYGPSFRLLKSTPEKQLAGWLLVKWLTSPENQARLAQADQFYPVRASSLEELKTLQGKYPQWEKAVEFLDSARSEPPFQSWLDVRWAVSDAATQLFRSYFSIDLVPTLVKLLDQTARDLQQITTPGP